MTNPSQIGRVADAIGESLLPGFIDLVAERRGDASYGGSTYMLSLGRTARLDDVRDGSEYGVVVETSTSDDGIVRIRSFAPISSEALHRVAQEKDVVFTVPSRNHEVRSRRSLMVGALELRSTPLSSPSGAEVSRILLETIRSLGGVDRALLQNMPQDKRASVEDLRQRVRLAMTLDSHSDWPSCFLVLDKLHNGTATEEDVSDIEALVEPWLSSERSLKVDFLEILRGSFSNDQLVRLNRDFPLQIDAPDGTRIPISYRGETPTASAKLQQFFGSVESPTVGPQNNRLPISLSLLSPAGKLLSETIDLPFFWEEVYPSVRSEMRGRYAKHPWPEDPMSAIPTRQTKKQQASSKTTGEDKRKTKSKNRKKKR
jgi:ATP-dependent helicase HrpB